MDKLSFDIERFVGVLSESSKGWTKELNLVSWNDRPAKYDIREWDPDHEKMGKGLTFTEQELLRLRDLLNTLELHEER